MAIRQIVDDDEKLPAFPVVSSLCGLSLSLVPFDAPHATAAALVLFIPVDLCRDTVAVVAVKTFDGIVMAPFGARNVAVVFTLPLDALNFLDIPLSGALAPVWRAWAAGRIGIYPLARTTARNALVHGLAANLALINCGVGVGCRQDGRHSEHGAA